MIWLICPSQKFPTIGVLLDKLGLLQISSKERLAWEESSGLSLSDELSIETEEKKFSILYGEEDRWLIPAFFLPSRDACSVRAEKINKKKAISFSGVLRANQKEGVQEALHALHEHTGIVLNADCGTGKTVMALFLLSKVRADKTVVLVDQIDIAQQWEKAIHDFLPELSVTIWGGGNRITSQELIEDVTIIIAQSLWRKDYLKDPIECDLLIVDEAHVFSAPKFCESICNLSFGYSIALTATIDRSDELEWIFQACLGSAIVRVAAKAWPATVYQVPLTIGYINHEDYKMAYCRRDGKMTWKARCMECPHWAGFPTNCGGDLKMNKKTVPPSINWGSRLNQTTMVKTLAEDPNYIEWLHNAIMELYRMGRNILALGEYVDQIKELYRRAAAELGSENVGAFIGKAKMSKEVDRKAELYKKITFCTYRVANKALDVPHKDAAILLTPRSDIRQAKGRIERVVVGKKYPLIIDPVVQDIGPLYGAAVKRKQQYEDSGCIVKKIWRFP
jgi:superfamily II DNA or RNA helicase